MSYLSTHYSIKKMLALISENQTFVYENADFDASLIMILEKYRKTSKYS